MAFTPAVRPEGPPKSPEEIERIMALCTGNVPPGDLCASCSPGSTFGAIYHPGNRPCISR